MPTPGQELASSDFESMLGGPLIAVVHAQAQAAISTVDFIKQVGFKPVNDQPPDGATTGDPIYVSFRYPKEIAPYVPGVGPRDGSLSLSLVNGGTGYTPGTTSVRIDDAPSDGTTATAELEFGPNGVITGVKLDRPGAGYVNPPVVTIVDESATGSGAAITASVNRKEQPAQFQEMTLEVPILTMLPIPYLRVDLVTIDFNAKINSMEYARTDESIAVNAEFEAKAGWRWGSVRLKVNAAYQRTNQSGNSVDRTYTMGVHIQASQDEMPGGMERILGILEDAIQSKPVNAPPPVLAG